MLPGIGNEADFLLTDYCSNGKGFGGSAFGYINFFQEFGCVFDDEFCVLLEVGGGEHVHGIDGSGVEEEDVLLVLLYVLTVEHIELVHPLYDLIPHLLQLRHLGTHLVYLSPELQLQLYYCVYLEGHLS